MKRFFILPMALVCLLVVAGSAFAQSVTLTATVRANPLEVEVIAPNTVVVGEWFEITADISNLGGETITKAYATIHKSPKLTVRRKKKKVGTLEAGQTKTITWLAKVRSSGNFIIYVEATGELAGEKISASDTDTMVVDIITSSSVWFLGSFFRLNKIRYF